MYLLEITIKMADDSEQSNFYDISGVDSREEAIEFQKRNLLSRIEKAKAGNKVWVDHSDNYAEWVDFLLV